VVKSDLFTSEYMILSFIGHPLFYFHQLLSYQRNNPIDGEEVKKKINHYIQKKNNILVFPEGTHLFKYQKWNITI
jgi:hypothetical protein